MKFDGAANFVCAESTRLSFVLTNPKSAANNRQTMELARRNDGRQSHHKKDARVPPRAGQSVGAHDSKSWGDFSAKIRIKARLAKVVMHHPTFGERRKETDLSASARPGGNQDVHEGYCREAQRP